MKTLVKWIIILLILILIAVIYLFWPTNSLDNSNPETQKSMVSTTLEWGRLAPFPTEKTDFTIRTEGSMFTRSFRGSFKASKSVIQSWLEASPGLQEAKIDIMPDGRYKYIITPVGGAKGAEVIINAKYGKVEFYVYWS